MWLYVCTHLGGVLPFVFKCFKFLLMYNKKGEKFLLLFTSFVPFLKYDKKGEKCLLWMNFDLFKKNEFLVFFTYNANHIFYCLHEFRGSYSSSLKIHAQPHCFVIIKKGEIVGPKGTPLWLFILMITK